MNRKKEGFAKNRRQSGQWMETKLHGSIDIHSHSRSCRYGLGNSNQPTKFIHLFTSHFQHFVFSSLQSNPDNNNISSFFSIYNIIKYEKISGATNWFFFAHNTHNHIFFAIVRSIDFSFNGSAGKMLTYTFIYIQILINGLIYSFGSILQAILFVSSKNLNMCSMFLFFVLNRVLGVNVYKLLCKDCDECTAFN